MKTTEYQRPPVRVALMGLGRSMFDDHYPVFKAHPALFRVVCACDIRKERRDRIEKDFPDCKMFRQYADMLDERDIDLVDIATPSVSHVRDAVKALNRGFWTLLETPMSLTLDDARVGANGGNHGVDGGGSGKLVVRNSWLTAHGDQAGIIGLDGFTVEGCYLAAPSGGWIGPNAVFAPEDAYTPFLVIDL